jgi:hypothetical protein
LGVPAISFSEYQASPWKFGVDLLGEKYTDDVVRVMESVHNNPVTIAISANATGKTHGAARIATWFYKCYPDAQVYTTAAPPEKNLRRLLWGEIYSIVHKHKDALFSSDRITGDLHVQSSDKCFITGVAIPAAGTPAEREAKFSGKHAPNILFIVDEGDAVPPEVYKGIESCMSGGNARLLIMFNPRSEVGRVADMFKKKQAAIVHLSAFSHPNVVNGTDDIPGAVTREKTIKRINEWTEPLGPGEKPDNECFEVPAFLVGTTCISDSGVEYAPLPAGWRRVVMSEFFYMVLGRYPPQSETQLISQVWLDNAVMRYKAYVAVHGKKPPINITPKVGMDVADHGVDLNSVCVRYGGLVMPIETWKGVDPDHAAIKSFEFVSRISDDTQIKLYNIPVFVDSTGVGAGVAPRMKRLGAAKASGVYVASSPTLVARDEATGDVLGEFFQLRDQLLWQCARWLEKDPGAMLPDDEDLLQELHTPTYEIKGGTIRVSNKVTMKELLGRSPDKMESLIMTFAPAAPTAGAMR